MDDSDADDSGTDDSKTRRMESPIGGFHLRMEVGSFHPAIADGNLLTRYRR
jgi:hypothetical protein